MASTGDYRALNHVTGVAGVITALVLAVQMRDLSAYVDRDIATAAGDLMLSGRLDVFAVMPKAQMGPLSIGLAGLLPFPVYVVLLCALVHSFIQLCYVATGAAPQLWHILGGVLMGAAWFRFAITGHADDVLVLLGAAAIAAARRRGVPWWAVVGFVVAMAAKPTAVLFLPLLWLISRRTAVLGFVGAGVVWAPFVLADIRGFLAAGAGVTPVFPYSLAGLLGAAPWSDYPWWVRPTQLVVCLFLCFAIGRRVSFPAAILAVIAARTAFEPGTYPLYWQSIVPMAFMVDLSARWRLFPALTTVALVGWMFGIRHAPTATEGLIRLSLLSLLVVAAATLRPADEREPQGDREPVPSDVRLGSMPAARARRRPRIDPGR